MTDSDKLFPAVSRFAGFGKEAFDPSEALFFNRIDSKCGLVIWMANKKKP